jgi:peroxiredoxin
MMIFRKNKSETVPLRSGEKAPNFQLPSVQGGLFRLDMRTAQGPVVLAFVDAGEGGRELLEHLKEHEAEFQRAGAYKYYRPNPENRTTGRPHSSIGPTVAATVAVVVRAEAMRPVREMQEQLELPYYVLWDEAGRVSGKYGVAEGEVAAAVVGADGTLTWFSESTEPPQVEQILRVVLPEQDENPDPET